MQALPKSCGGVGPLSWTCLNYMSRGAGYRCIVCVTNLARQAFIVFAREDNFGGRYRSASTFGDSFGETTSLPRACLT